MSGSNEMARAKARYAEAKDFARRQSAVTLGPVLGVDFYVTSISLRAIEAVGEQWPIDLRKMKEGGWDWAEIRRRFSEMSVMDMAIWGQDDSLLGLGVCRATGQAVIVEFVEGDPRDDCPLAGQRLLIVLEAAAYYAQKLGKIELQLQLVNNHLKDLIEETYGFSLVTPRKGSPYYRKEI